jgi:hypothetical protein
VTTDRAPDAGTFGDDAVPVELVEAGRRRTATRRRAAHALQRASHRRRIATTSIVGALVVVSVGLADAGVQRTLPTAASPSTAATSAQALKGANALLARVARTFRADQLMLTRLEDSTKAALSARSPVVIVAPTPYLPATMPTSGAPAPAVHVVTGASSAG